MTSKIINTPKIFVLLVSVLFALVPVVTASPGNAGNSGEEVNECIAETSYSIVSAGESSPITSDDIMFAMTTQYISKSKTLVHAVNIGSAVNFLEVDLNWGTRSSILLTIRNSDGQSLGTYKDNADGITNGRIHLYIYPSGNYIQPTGSWKFSVYAESIGGTSGSTQRYTFNAYQH